MEAQQWTDNLPKGKLQTGDLTFYEIQQAFNDYWAPFHVKNGYYRDQNGDEVKALGWKQFRRWEYYWENRIVKETGQFPKTSASEELAKYLKEHPEQDSPTGTWTSLGPFSAGGGYSGLGRINCAGFVAGDNNTIYVGSPSGGIWKTADGGTNWTPLGDHNAVLGVSDIAAYRPVSSPDVIYIATGDRDGGSMWSLGGGQYNDNNSVGVLKSTDGGTTWNTTGLSFTVSQLRTVNRLLMHPTDNTILYAATSVGVYKTINGGAAWTLLTATAFIDMEFKPGTPSTIYGSTKEGDIYRSINDGVTWSATLSTTNSRTELAVSANNPAIVYAVVSNSSSGLAGIYKSTDSGATFIQVFSGATINILNNACSSTTSGGQAWYDLCIASDPTNANVVFVGGVNTWKSTNGGSAWTLSNHWTSSYGCLVPEVHADKHCLAYQNGTSTLFEGNDGGLYKTTNIGSTWTNLGNGLVTSQLYRLGVAQTVANENIIGLQDNGTKAFLSGTWNDEIGGDGFECAIDYTNQNTLYGELYYGDIYRSTNHGGSWTNIVSGLTGSGWWCTPFVIDPNLNTTLYIGYQDVFKSTNQGTAWTKISTLGGNSMKALAVAPSNSLYIYAATATVLYRTTVGGTTWTNITGTIPVGSGDITYICVKSNDPNTVWVTLGGYNSTRIFQTINGGTTWTDISAGLPSIPVMCIVQNKQNTAQVELYAGTDVGVYTKTGSSNWTMFSNGLPNVVVNELDIYYNAANPALSRLRAATSGRGLWQSDLASTPVIPVANFSASNTSPIINTLVTFTDNSSNTPTSWIWSFAPSTVTYVNGTTSTSQNPQVQFTVAGDYSVTLTAANASGSDPETKANYIHAIGCTVSSFPWNEGFNVVGTMPPCWTQQAVTGTLSWAITAGSPSSVPSAANTGGSNASFYEGTYGVANVAKLVTPTLNITALASPKLKFWHTQAYWYPDQDELRIFYKTSSGGSWVLLATYTNTIAVWTQEVIDLPAQSSDYSIAFEATEKFGYGVCIDDVEITGTPVPASVVIQNVTVPSATSSCFNAVQTISVAGGGSLFTVQIGGNATLIAGQNILFYPGTSVAPGGYLHGYIASAGPWCSLPPVGNAPLTSTKEINPGTEKAGYRIYPNPTTGNFTLEINDHEISGGFRVEIYNMEGQKMLMRECEGEWKQEFSLTDKPAGIYLIRIISGRKSETMRIIKQTRF
jgi:PKD repeat protein